MACVRIRRAAAHVFKYVLSRGSMLVETAMSIQPSYSDANPVREKLQDIHTRVSVLAVDTAARLVTGHEIDELDPGEAIRIRKKIDLHILPLMCILYCIQFMDKTTLGSAAILGISESTHLTTDQYNWLGTIFYLSYLVFEFPQNLALQAFPVGKWMSINIFIWGVCLCCHAACTNFAGLFIVRAILGICEGSIMAGFLIVSSMFYTRREQTLRVGYWFLMNGTAQILSGFLSFGVLHINTVGFEPWQWLMVITGALTLVMAVAYWVLFPDSPTNAWFLTIEERQKAIQRIKENQTGVENKHFKMAQCYEALWDLKTWLFVLFTAVNEIQNSLTNQRSIIISSFGFSNIQTTLLGCVDGFLKMSTIWIGVTVAARLQNSRAYVGAVYFIPALTGALLINLLPWDNKIGLLFAQWLAGVGPTTALALSFSWLSSVTAGHTKRVTVNAIVLIGFCIGNAAGSFMWQEKYKPRNRIPWIVISICYVVAPLILLIIRIILVLENRKRKTEPVDKKYDDVYIEVVTDDGKQVEYKVDKEFLDLTDIQNREFVYVL